ncbi:dihydroorotase [Novosphingobium flavum]|uniref:Dihydroorotase n=1 Tax=Novosphingobium flavum TaxID=1778672 RepID=A0A7X1KM98_9SPHN|nr:dihydroorotase [Novosphingobium flavum]MBC2666416.1 dihydroorotase [Novosphingobium flavum]
MTDSLTIRRPDDWHVHLRDGAFLADTVAHTARQFARAIVMPNLSPPVTTTALALAYRDRIAKVAPAGFTPLMTLYLTDGTDPVDMAAGFANGAVTACKLYPAHATTNSAHGVTDIRSIYPVLETMQAIGMPLLVHGEVTDAATDIFDREAVFIERVLIPTLRDFPALKLVFEHITTKEAAEFVAAAPDNVAATITCHHLVINRNAIFAGGIRPHAYCLPIAKREVHRLALRKAATSGSAKFFLGTDTAPHLVQAKESGCGCAGIFNAPNALESYVTVFDEEGALGRFEAFASENGPKFYGLPLNEGTVTLTRGETVMPARLPMGEGEIVPWLAGETMNWRFAGAEG